MQCVKRTIISGTVLLAAWLTAVPLAAVEAPAAGPASRSSPSDFLLLVILLQVHPQRLAIDPLEGDTPGAVHV